jgi:predicted DNA-binding ribbon-helix-helix protein
VKKRSVLLRGHATSVSVEDEFWIELKRMAAEAGMPVASLIQEIDGERRGPNLSSALRLAVLTDLQGQAGAIGRGQRSLTVTPLPSVR